MSDGVSDEIKSKIILEMVHEISEIVAESVDLKNGSAAPEMVGWGKKVAPVKTVPGFSLGKCLQIPKKLLKMRF